jgi:3-oxoacyl-[acyl-carrier-protein] synthase II
LSGGILVDQRRVVVTGLGCVSALGVGVEKNWHALLEARSGIDRISLFDTAGFPVTIAGEASDFDPLEHMTKMEARKLDRCSQLGLVAADEAIKDADFPLDSCDPTRVGCILGTGIGGIGTLEAQKEVLLKRGPTRISPFMVPMMMSNALAGVISIKYGFLGPSFTTASACASAASALGVALNAIRSGEVDAVVSGGGEAAVTGLCVGGFSSMKALSTRNDEPQRASRPFDKNRDGFVLGEGAAVLVLEELESAKKRGAKIWAELKGYASTADAFHITAPKEGGDGPRRAMLNAIANAGLLPEDIDYINAHGTSTPLNDGIETAAIRKAFGDRAGKIPVSSSKSMVGHLLGGSAALETMVAVHSVYSGAIHPTINYETPDPACDLDYVPNEAREIQVRNALSNSLGFGGHNVCIVVGAL